MVYMYVLLVVVVLLLVGGYVGRKTAPKPTPSAARAPKVFGATEARKLRMTAGVFQSGDSRIIKMTTLMNGADFRVLEDLAAERAAYAKAIATEQDSIVAYEAKIERAKTEIAMTTGADADAASLVGVFSGA